MIPVIPTTDHIEDKRSHSVHAGEIDVSHRLEKCTVSTSEKLCDNTVIAKNHQCENKTDPHHVQDKAASACTLRQSPQKPTDSSVTPTESVDDRLVPAVPANSVQLQLDWRRLKNNPETLYKYFKVYFSEMKLHLKTECEPFPQLLYKIRMIFVC